MSAILDRGLTAEQLADCEANDRQLSDWQRQMASSIASIPLDDESPRLRKRGGFCSECHGQGGSHAWACPERTDRE